MLVDIMVPAYGDDALLRETVRSVVAQTDDHWRLTVIDDRASTTGAEELRRWLDEFHDSRITFLANPERLGINRNFQRCFDRSSAELVQVLGADDRLLPDVVARVRAAARDRPEAEWFHTGATIIDGAGAPTRPLVDRVKQLVAVRARRDRVIGGEELAASLLRGNWMYFPSVVFRRTVVDRHGFREGYDIVLDLDLYLRVLRAGAPCLLFARPGIEYRRHAASLSSSQADDGTRFAEEIAYFRQAADEMAAHGWPRAARAARLHLTSRLHAAVRAVALAAAGRWSDARFFASHVVRSSAARRIAPEEVRA